MPESFNVSPTKPLSLAFTRFRPQMPICRAVAGVSVVGGMAQLNESLPEGRRAWWNPYNSTGTARAQGEGPYMQTTLMVRLLLHPPTLPAFYTLYVRVVLRKGGGRTGWASSGSTAWAVHCVPLSCYDLSPSSTTTSPRHRPRPMTSKIIINTFN
jgi:hypothetical protein